MKQLRFNSVIYHLFVALFGFAMLYPILWTLASSLKPNSEVFGNPTSLIPSEFVWSNYTEGWKGFGGYTFGHFFANSGIITGLVVIGAIFSSTFVAFGFARLKFRMRRFLFACLIITMMLPSQVTLIPQYVLFHKLGWVNTFLPLVVPSFIGGSPFFIFLIIQFIRGIPKELDQAAVIDGTSTFGLFWRIILPLMKPAMATVAIFSFYWTWEDFMGPLIYLNETKLFTVSLGLQMFSDPSAVTQWGSLFAMSILSLVPVFIIFLLFQKYLVQGIATTGLKG
jgi:multiple sugar transport system permease protein